jgi:ribosomal protein S12 methylthiotransferase accessory factor
MKSQLKRLKPYKANPPSLTIDLIKSLLFELDFHFIEYKTNTNPFFKSCTLSMINPSNKQSFFSTYGKGVSVEWASASAWGEMAERIQNLAFFMMFLYPSQPEKGDITEEEFKYFPDEKKLNYNIETLNHSIYNSESLNGYSRTFSNYIGVPFFSLFENKPEYLPFRALQLIAGSNGMCSGNTKEEAIIQGISEIFERFVLKKLYEKPICPPDVPSSFFKRSDIYNAMNTIAVQYNLKIKIKDCSLGKNYPVIGVLILNGKNEYAFHLGADPSPITALERCFCEMFQNGRICFKSIDELNDHLPYDPTTVFWKINLNKTISSYSGHWPNAILNDHPDYNFMGFSHPVSVSDQEDLQFLIDILKSENRKVFIRDNSFLGQPAYYIYIPEMSEITNFQNDLFPDSCLNLDKSLPTLTNLKASTLNDRTELYKTIINYINNSPIGVFEPLDYLKYYREHPIGRLSAKEFKSLLELSMIEGKISDVFSKDEIRSNEFLNAVYLKEGNFKPINIFNIIDIPKCFNCNTCNQKYRCNFHYISEFWLKIRHKIELKPINQGLIFYQ